MDEVKWHDETIWPQTKPIDSSSLMNSKNVLLIHCPLCPFFTFNYNRLLEHLSISKHSGVIECVFYRCSECNRISTSSLLLKEHFTEEHADIISKHSTPISCLGVQRFTMPKTALGQSSLEQGELAPSTGPEQQRRRRRHQCLLCSYQLPDQVGGDGSSAAQLAAHYVSEHNMGHQLCQQAGSQLGQVVPDHMQMSDGTLIVLPEEPPSDKPQPLPVLQGSRKRKLNQPMMSNGNGFVCHEEFDDDEDDDEDMDDDDDMFDPDRQNGFSAYYSEEENSRSNASNHMLQHQHNSSSSNQFVSGADVCMETHLQHVVGSMMPPDEDEHSSNEAESSASQSLLGPLLTPSTNGCWTPGAGTNGAMGVSPMFRKRGRPPKVSSHVLARDEIEQRLRPHVTSLGKNGTENKEMVRIASGEPYSVTVPFSMLVSAFDTDGVQFLKNLIRYHYKPAKLALFAWDVSQKRGRPRTSINVMADLSETAFSSNGGGSGINNIALESLRQEPFVQASMCMIQNLFNQEFPPNLPVFINRLLQNHRYYLYSNNSSSTNVLSQSSAPTMIGGGDNGEFAASFHAEPQHNNNNGANVYNFTDESHHSHKLDGSPIHSSFIATSPYKDAELRLSRHWIPCPDNENEVQLSLGSPRITKQILISVFDPDPLRFFRALVKLAVPMDDLLHATWKGKNTGRPRYNTPAPSSGPGNAGASIACSSTNPDEPDSSSSSPAVLSFQQHQLTEDKRPPLIEHPMIRALLEFVPRVCERPLPENLGPIIHQLLASVRKTHLQLQQPVQHQLPFIKTECLDNLVQH